MSEKMQIHRIFSFKNAREQHLCIIGVNGKEKKKKVMKLRSTKLTRVGNEGAKNNARRKLTRDKINESKKNSR